VVAASVIPLKVVPIQSRVLICCARAYTMTKDEWMDLKTALTAFGRDGVEWRRLRWAIMAGPIRVKGQKAQDPQSEAVDIPAEHLADGTFELPDTVIVPGTPPIKYIKVRFSQPAIGKFLEKRRASQAAEAHQRGVYYYDEPRWPLHRALEWIAFRRPEARALNLDEFVLDRCAALRGYGDAAGLVIGNPADELLKALKAGELKAIDANLNELPAEFWDERSSDPRTWPEVRFRREDMRRPWPGRELPDEVTENTSNSAIQESVGTSGEETTPPAESRRKRSSPKQAIARGIFVKEYPNGVPGRDERTDGELVQQVTSSLPPRSKGISRDSILRAAGRRVDKP
jgi:hypothetical protein